VADLATPNASSCLWICRRTDPTFANLVRSWLSQFISSKDRSPFSGRGRKSSRGEGGREEGVVVKGWRARARPKLRDAGVTTAQAMVGQWAGCRPL
jgi:hypothetical protein